ncbi:MAG: corrinoid protein [Thermodesulfobacteriota bacterium]|nr:corrinoid protein [Thermodesulfobacteriota bacterium]
MSDQNLKKMTETLISGEEKELLQLVNKTLDEGISAKVILNDGLICGMDIVGEKMETGDMFIPEVLRSARAMSGAVEILKPLLGEKDIRAGGKVVIGTVKGDLHDIGKNLVVMMLESAGFEVHNIGVDISPEKFVTAIKEKEADILALSALLTTTMNMMKVTIDAVREGDLGDTVKILIGGAPVTQEFADKIGADGYAPDAGSATKLAKALLA